MNVRKMQALRLLRITFLLHCNNYLIYFTVLSACFIQDEDSKSVSLMGLSLVVTGDDSIIITLIGEDGKETRKSVSNTLHSCSYIRKQSEH